MVKIPINTINFINIDDDALIKYFSEDERSGYLLINIRLKQLTFRWWELKKTEGVKAKKEKVTVVKLGGLDFVKDEVIDTAICNKKIGDKMVFLFGKASVYTVDMETREITEVNPWDVANLTLIDNHYLYSIMNENSDQSSGFYIQSMNTFLNRKTKKVDL